MNILNLLTKKRHTVGVEISDLTIRIAYLRQNKKNKHLNLPENEFVLIEEAMPPDTIKNGIILKREILEKTISDIWEKEKLTKSYAVVSIQEDNIYSRLFPFPKNIDEQQLTEAINLTIDFQLPSKKDTVYSGWENTNTLGTNNEIIISTISKDIANDYIKALSNSGIHLLALESQIASISRSIKNNNEDLVLYTKKNQSSTTIFILKNNIFQFSRTIPELFSKDGNYLEKEINKIKNSFESESKDKIVDVVFNDASINDKYKECLNEKIIDGLQYKWLISIGAAIRGEIPQGKDAGISLLPVGTNEAYKYQKNITLISLIRNITISVSVFFLIAFIAAYLFIFSISETMNNNSNISKTPISPDIKNKELLINNVNSITLVSESFLSNSTNWSILIDDINSRTISGIIISNFRIISINETISITGISKNRDTLNMFKNSLKESPYLTDIELPITNLEQKEDIPFSISLKIKDPSLLYYK